MNPKNASLVGWLAMLLSVAALTGAAVNVYQRGFFSSRGDQEIVVSSQPRQDGARQVDMNQIIDAHLFGRVPVKNKPKKKQVVAPKTKLKLTLTGVFESPRDGLGRAIIAVAGGKTIVVKVGDPIGKTGATLHEIEPDFVLIDRNGNLERLPMVRKRLKGTSQVVAVVNPTPEQDVSALPQPRNEVYEPPPEPEHQPPIGPTDADMRSLPPFEGTQAGGSGPEPVPEKKPGTGSKPGPG